MTTTFLSPTAGFPRISRQLTTDTEVPHINVRPIVKGAVNEASHTLAEAYRTNPVLSWCASGLSEEKHEEFLYAFFKDMILSSTLSSRDYALQVEGCKGTMIWSAVNPPRRQATTAHTSSLERRSSWSNSLSTTVRMARLIGWTSARRTFMRFQPACDKLRRTLMGPLNERGYLIIHYLGVLPIEQGKGLGRAMVEHILQKADDAHCPVYVQVDRPETVDFFERFGFTVRAKAGVVGHEGPEMAILVRDPETSLNMASPGPLQIAPGRRIST